MLEISNKIEKDASRRGESYKTLCDSDFWKRRAEKERSDPLQQLFLPLWFLNMN